MRIHRFGDGGALSLDEVERPEPQPGELLVRLAAASVNPIDDRIRSGSFPGVRAEHLPYCLGCDLAGDVVAVGDGVTSFAVGDAVYAMIPPGRGTYAEYAVVNEVELAHAPSGIPLGDAATLPLAALTAWQGLNQHAPLEPGQRVLIHGGAGGVGHLAVQLAKAAGATVFATGSGAKQEWLAALGADMPIDYRRVRFEDVAWDIDVVLDLVGGETLARSWSVLRRGGRIMSAVGMPDPAGAMDATVSGARFVARPSGTDLAEITLLIDSGRVTPHVSARYPLAEAERALARLAQGGVDGKIVLIIAEGAT